MRSAPCWLAIAAQFSGAYDFSLRMKQRLPSRRPGNQNGCTSQAHRAAAIAAGEAGLIGVHVTIQTPDISKAILSFRLRRPGGCRNLPLRIDPDRRFRHFSGYHSIAAESRNNKSLHRPNSCGCSFWPRVKGRDYLSSVILRSERNSPAFISYKYTPEGTRLPLRSSPSQTIRCVPFDTVSLTNSTISCPKRL